VPVHGEQNLIEILSTINLSEEIPTELYKAVAEIIAYIYKTSGRL
jgi:flagellar biosynthesis protein